jgi:ribonuclease E
VQNQPISQPFASPVMETATSAAAVTDAIPARMEAPVDRPTEASPVPATIRHEEPAMTAPVQAPHAPAPAHEPEPVPASFATEKVVELRPSAPAPVSPRPAPIVLPPDLSQVETDPAKLHLAARDEPPPPPRPPRVRPMPPPVSNEPLAQVETRKQ